MAQSTYQYIQGYGKASEQTTRFQIIGDNRVMYPIFASGSTYDWSTPPHHYASGSSLASLTSGGHRNMICNAEAAFAFGAKSTIVAPVAIRLGVSVASGGNILYQYADGTDANEYGIVHATQRLDSGNHYTYLANGEAAFQDTNGAQYGAAIEQFQVNVAGTVTAAASGSTLTGAGTTFLTATLSGVGGIYNGIYIPSLATVVSGDLVQIVDGANVFWHRIRTITDNLHMEVYPNLVGSGTAGRAYTIWRSGYGSYSRIVSIYNSNTGGTAPMSFFNYYIGGHRSTTFPGTIMCYTREASGAVAASHFTGPQTSGVANDIKAVDIAYYKQFMLYGFGSAVGWSVAGFPTSFTTGFGAGDFPASNVSAVAIDDQFVAFEYLGEQLMALFKNSIWEVQATGSVPEFAFYKLPEPIGPVLQSKASIQTPFRMWYRPTTSGRNAIYYHSHTGLLELAGKLATQVSIPVRGQWQSLDQSAVYNPSLTWEPATNSIIAHTPIGSSHKSDFGLIYSADTGFWSVYDPCVDGATTARISDSLRGSSCTPAIDNFCVFGYSGSNERIIQIDAQIGAPFATNLGNSVWSWTTPVVSLGDQYGSYIVTGFQVDGQYTSTTNWQIFVGKSPYAVNVLKASGTMASQDNRNILGVKVDDAFMQMVFSTNDGSWASIAKVNLYAEGLGH